MTEHIKSVLDRTVHQREQGLLGGTPTADARARPISRTLSEVVPERVTWLSPGRIALGKVTVIEGDPGLGKSTLLLDLAARLSRGEGLPGDPPMEPADTILLTAEDGIADTVLPRLLAAGADCTRVRTLDGFRRYDGKVGEIVLGDPDDPSSLEALEARIVETGARLVVVDVLAAFLSGARDSYRDTDMRATLRPLAELAARTGCAIVVVRHRRKATGGKAISAGGGSIAISGAARSVLLVDADPDDPERRVLASVKCNLAAPPPSLIFRIEHASSGGSRIVWLGETSHTAETLTHAREETANDRDEVGHLSKTDECAAVIQEWLAEGPMDRKDVLRLGVERGFSASTVERAARSVGVRHDRSGSGKESRSMWSFPGAGESSVDAPPEGGGDMTDQTAGYVSPPVSDDRAEPEPSVTGRFVNPPDSDAGDGTDESDGSEGAPVQPAPINQVDPEPAAVDSSAWRHEPEPRPSWARSPLRSAVRPLGADQ